MFLLGYFLEALARVLDLGLSLYTWILIISALLSWVQPDPFNPIVRFLHQVTEPLLERIRRRLPWIAGGIDFSPLVAILILVFLQEFLVRSLQALGARFLP